MKNESLTPDMIAYLFVPQRDDDISSYVGCHEKKEKITDNLDIQVKLKLLILSLRLYHISEETNIQIFHPRISKRQWNYEKYVWAIEEEKLHNYLLPRDCPRICVNLEKLNSHSNWFDIYSKENQKAIIFVSENWKQRIQNCKLFKYEFLKSNFKVIDKIAGYFVSEKSEIPTNKILIENCEQELINSNVKLIVVKRKRMLEIKEEVVKNLKDFSIIKWNKFE